MLKLAGSCLCGEIRFEIDGKVSPMEACHCSRCRKTSGSAFSTALLCSTKSFKWLCSEDKITDFRLPSGFAHSFCSICGSPIPDSGLNGKVKGIPAGCLEGDPEVKIKWHAFVGSKASWFDIVDEVEQYEEQADHSQS